MRTTTLLLAVLVLCAVINVGAYMEFACARKDNVQNWLCRANGDLVKSMGTLAMCVLIVYATWRFGSYAINGS